MSKGPRAAETVPTLGRARHSWDQTLGQDSSAAWNVVKTLLPETTQSQNIRLCSYLLKQWTKLYSLKKHSHKLLGYVCTSWNNEQNFTPWNHTNSHTILGYDCTSWNTEQNFTPWNHTVAKYSVTFVPFETMNKHTNSHKLFGYVCTPWNCEQNFTPWNWTNGCKTSQVLIIPVVNQSFTREEKRPVLHNIFRILSLENKMRLKGEDYGTWLSPLLVLT